MADGDDLGVPGNRNLSPAQEAGPDLPSRVGVPEWVPSGREQRWHDSVKIAEDLFGPGERAAVWQSARTIFSDEATYPD